MRETSVSPNGCSTRFGQRSSSNNFLHLSSLLKRSNKETMFMVQTHRKKRKRELTDEQLAVKVFGKRLKK